MAKVELRWIVFTLLAFLFLPLTLFFFPFLQFEFRGNTYFNRWLPIHHYNSFRWIIFWVRNSNTSVFNIFAPMFKLLIC